jgi:hypothetical protein
MCNFYMWGMLMDCAMTVKLMIHHPQPYPSTLLKHPYCLPCDVTLILKFFNQHLSKIGTDRLHQKLRSSEDNLLQGSSMATSEI